MIHRYAYHQSAVSEVWWIHSKTPASKQRSDHAIPVDKSVDEVMVGRWSGNVLLKQHPETLVNARGEQIHRLDSVVKTESLYPKPGEKLLRMCGFEEGA